MFMETYLADTVTKYVSHQLGGAQLLTNESVKL